MKIAWPKHHLSRWSRRLTQGLTFALVSFFMVTTLALPGTSVVPSASTPSGLDNPPGLDQLIAQNPITLLEFRTPNFSVRVFNSGGITRMNVYRSSPAPGQLEQNAQPATLNAQITDFTAYDSFGSRNNTNVIFRAAATRNPQQAKLEIISQANNSIILTEFATQILTLNIPSTPGGNADLQNTILAFETPIYAVRVFRDGNTRKMNVFNRATSQQVVNGKVAEVVNPSVAPYEGWVSYYAGEAFNGIAGRYYARVNGRGDAILEFIDANNRVLFTESRTSTAPLVVNIPPGDIPPGVDTPATSANLNPFVAAVFGGDSTLEELRTLYNSGRVPSATGQSLPEPFFESARQGQFINAGSFTNRDQAAALVSYLRSQGFNARLVYRDFRYR